MAIESRLMKLEKALETEAGERRAYSHLQLVRAARGEDPGFPEVVLKPGEKSHAELIVEAAQRGKGEGTP